jgi:protein-S-isoprenylcysteine O-methyltransferase Ste14
MSKRIIRSDTIGQLVGAVIAASAVTAASYIWRLPQAHSPKAVLAVYVVSAILMVVGAFIIFRRVVRRGYEQNRRLTPLPFFLQLLIWGMFFAFPCIYNPFNWAWSQSSVSQAIPILGGIGWACVWIGLLILAIAVAWLGLLRSCGQGVNKLEMGGLYRVTRNPQLMGGVLIIIGYTALWPSWYALGWVVLYAIMAQMMVLTEERHLHAVHGEPYAQYCKRVPRYLGFPRRP